MAVVNANLGLRLSLQPVEPEFVDQQEVKPRLALTHGLDACLATAVPTAPQWPMDRLPKVIPVDEL